jgi:hypothetical protein
MRSVTMFDIAENKKTPRVGEFKHCWVKSGDLRSDGPL